jgi:hypothetical protein
MTQVQYGAVILLLLLLLLLLLFTEQFLVIEQEEGTSQCQYVILIPVSEMLKFLKI